MRVGNSLSRCVYDIYKGVVDINEVLVIIARTNFDPENDEHWNSIWYSYSSSVWHNIPFDDKQKLRDICISLKKQGKLHQPRQFGAHPINMKYQWYNVMLSDQETDSNSAAKKAWNNYKIIAGLI